MDMKSTGSNISKYNIDDAFLPFIKLSYLDKKKENTNVVKEESTKTEETPKEETTVGTITKESLMSNATGLSNHLINSKGKVDKNLKLNKKNLKKYTEEKKTTKNYYPLFISVGIVIILGGIIYVNI